MADAALTRAPEAIVRSPGYWSTVLRRFFRDPVAVGALIVILLIVLMALLAPWIAPGDPYKGMALRRLKPPGTEGFPLGTDELGRDMLTRLIYGARLSLLMGVTPVFLALFFGSLIGITAGYVGGWVNSILMRTMDVFFAFPSVLLAIALAGAMGDGGKFAAVWATINMVLPVELSPVIFTGLLALTIVFVPPIARVAESVTTSMRGREFVEAARASGAGSLSIIRHHILGNVLGPIFVYAMSLIAVCMILASGLSFLGLGVKPPEPEWGLMLNTLRTAIYTQPLLCALPGIMIFITSISFNLMTDGLRSAMDIKA
ncbi:MAG TPA: ABC transporter permease [Hyphomicrobiaceae bacterium]|nr:ABC transporter permease [Hyphomicrobiaceae bacterium]